MCPGRVGRATYTNNDGVRALITFSPNLGLKVFMDAHQPVTLKEGDRYPLRPPSYLRVDESVKSSLLVGQKGSKDLGGSIPLSGAKFLR
jgi:hypothetical protein